MVGLIAVINVYIISIFFLVLLFLIGTVSISGRASKILAFLFAPITLLVIMGIILWYIGDDR